MSVAETAALLQAKQDLRRMKQAIDNSEEFVDIAQAKHDLRQIEQKVDLVCKLEAGKQRRAQMRTATTYNNKAFTSISAPHHSNKALMSQQMSEIKSGLAQHHQMQFNQRYNELAHDPAQQEAMVGWYHTRLKSGYVGF